MIKFLIASLIFLVPFSVQAENISLNFNSVPLPQFAQSAFKVMMKRDYVVSNELLALDKVVSVSVRTIDSAQLPKFIDDVLLSQGVRSVLRDGVYYLDINNEAGAASGGRVLQLSGNLSSNPVTVGNIDNLAVTKNEIPFSSTAEKPIEVFETDIFTPRNRDSDFIVLALNSVFVLKPASVAGSVVVISAPKDILNKALSVARSIDTAPHKVKVSATFVEVSTNESSGVGVSVIANLLGVKLGVKLGDASTRSLSLSGQNFQVVLDALASDGRFRQVSNPTALVDDYQKTNISFGDSVPTVSSNSVDKNGNALQQIVYQQSGVLLNVTPKVLGSGKINIVLDGQVSSFAVTTTGVTNSPTLSKRQVQTNLTLDDGEIIVIGGLNNNKSSANEMGFSFFPKSWSLKNGSQASTDLVLILSATVIN